MNLGLTTYLHDHLAGANAAVEVIGLLQKHSGEPMLVSFLNSLSIEVQEDKQTLEAFLSTLAQGPSTIKDSAAWVSSRLVGFKVREGKRAFGAFEALEFLALGIQANFTSGKRLNVAPPAATFGTSRISDCS